MSPADRYRITHMVEAAEAALQFVEGRRREDLDSDRQLVMALTRAVEIVGEAATQVTEVTRAELPDVPWAQITGMRHRRVGHDAAAEGKVGTPVYPAKDAERRRPAMPA